MDNPARGCPRGFRTVEYTRTLVGRSRSSSLPDFSWMLRSHPLVDRSQPTDVSAHRRSQVVKLATMLACLFVVAGSGAVVSHADERPVRVLITGEPRQVSLIQDRTSATGTPGEVYVGSLLRVTLGDVRVVFGEGDVEKTITVEMTAAHRFDTASHQRIFALLEADQKHWKVLYWGFPEVVGCVPAELIKGTDLEAFVRFHASEGMDCANVM